MTLAIADYLGQDQLWRDRDGVEHRIDDMAVTHRRDALAWLRGQAERLHADRAVAIADTDDSFATSVALREHYAVEPAQWLDDQPLTRRLATLDARWRWLTRTPRRWWR